MTSSDDPRSTNVKITPVTGPSMQLIDACARLLIETFAGAPWNETWIPSRAQARIQEILDSAGAQAVVAETEGQVVGVAMGNTEATAAGESFYLRELCVGASWQNHGLGSRLVAALSGVLEREGVASVYLVTRSGTPAHEYYLRKGFHEGGIVALHAPLQALMGGQR